MDRRLFSRLHVNLEGLSFFHKDEHPIDITNISEEGIGFTVGKINLGPKMLKKGDVIDVEFTDELRWFGRLSDEIHIIRVKIAQIRKEGEKFYLGCRVIHSENNYKSYVEKRKCTCFMEHLGKRRCKRGDGSGS